MKKNIAFCLIILFSAVATKAQLQNDERPRKLLYYFNGGIGVYIPMSTHGALSETGSIGSFQFQVDYKKHLFGRFFFDQYNIAFHTMFTTSDGSNVLIKGKVPTTIIGLETGYGWHIKRFSPYGYLGTGIAVTDVPYLKENAASKKITLTSDSQSSIALRAGLGINYKISRLFIIYLESQFLSFPVSTQVYDGNLNGISLHVGFKTPLQ